MAMRGLTNKGERAREMYRENTDMGRRECMFVIERSPGDRDGTTNDKLESVCVFSFLMRTYHACISEMEKRGEEIHEDS